MLFQSQPNIQHYDLEILAYSFLHAAMNKSRCALAADQTVMTHELTAQNMENRKHHMQHKIT